MLSRIWGGRKAANGAPIVVSPDDESKKRDRQKNVKATQMCLDIFSQCAKAQGVSEAALFEDLVAERQEALRKAGVRFKVAKR